MDEAAERPACVWDAGAILGEGPVWSDVEHALYWVDIRAPRVFRFIPASGAQTVLSVPEPIGCVAVRACDGLIAALDSGFAFIDVDNKKIDPISTSRMKPRGTRFNDGKPDPFGGF